jgi:arabinose-5-phosphate isomerase
MQINNIAKKVFKTEAKAIANLANLLTEDFKKTVKCIINSRGKVIVTGMGKSGLIGKKIAATLASTGTPSFFLHPGEAYHGDLGTIEKNDIVLLLSNSGETDEVLKIIPFLKNQGNITISITGNPDSTLAKNSDFHLNIFVEKEGCPLNLAPMASTTATLVMGDALAAALMKKRGFQEKDFAEYHPGGSLGRRLLTKVKDVMHKNDLPVSFTEDNIKDIIKTISKSKFGLTVVINDSNDSVIKGVISDGDIRRAMDDEKNFFKLKAIDIMTTEPKTIDLNKKLTDAQRLMTDLKINSLLVTQKHKFVGIIQIYDLGL